ncbi:uncharacterized protein LOC132544385 [Ylistrum balloti]|uniref:uncharacterized protein LOC132544385 n=1 Tax=Ylistrum balloti TaxID=509963 RepID=UPI0029058A77|nr:uncharacterized protein LOC132544385 [Ylistrum balloti]
MSAICEQHHVPTPTSGGGNARFNWYHFLAMMLKGRNILCHELSSPKHERICPCDYFKDNTVGLRDVILQVIKLLKKDKKVVIDDENASAMTRESYVRMVQRKISSKTIASVKVIPAMGRIQLLWSREYYLAENSHKGTSQELSTQDGDINKWFSEGDTDHINYSCNEVSDPSFDEGIQVFERTIPLTVKSQYKFEVPALCMQWEGMICGTTEEPRLLPEVVSICQHWSDANVGGRIFIICDNTISISGSSGQHQQENTECRKLVKTLVKQFCGCPVYMFCVENSADAVNFTKPPNPGILAYLQRRHHLNINSKDSVYLYQSQNHKMVAETSGMPHLKMSRAVLQPSLVDSSHVFSIPNIPLFLKELNMLPLENFDQRPPEIPGIQDVSFFEDNEISMHLGYGRREFLFAKDIDTLAKFNKTYAEMASLSTAPFSKFLKSNSIKEPGDKADSQRESAKKARLSKSLSSDRELPHWMMSDRKTKGISQSSKPSISNTDSTDSTNTKYKRTKYVMTETELTEIAKDILKQAGREDLIRNIQLQQLRENVINRHESSTTQKQKKEKCLKFTEDHSSSMDVNLGEEEGTDSFVDVLSSQCDIAPQKDSLTRPASNMILGDVKFEDRNPKSVSSTSVLDSFVINDEVRKKSQKKTLRKPLNIVTKHVMQDEHDISEQQRKNLSPKKPYKLLTEKSESDPVPAGEQLSEANVTIQERTEITHDQFTEISRRKLPDLSVLDEIFS